MYDDFNKPENGGNEGFSAGSEYHFGRNAEPLPNSDSHYSEPVSYSVYSGNVGGDKKPKKPKRKFDNPVAVTIAFCIICSLLSSIITSVIFLYSFPATVLPDDTSTNQSNSSNEIIIKQTEENAAVAIAKKVVPSVVGIQSTVNVGFWGESSQSEGSGVIYSQDGYIITNFHVISNAVKYNNTYTSNIMVYLSSKSDEALKCEVIGYDTNCDIAVLKIDKTGLDAIEFADSDNLSVGEAAVAVGNPGGLEYMGSVSTGIISGLNRRVSSEIGYIQTDAAINPGNSGGALVNGEGLLIGINTSKISATEYEGMGFALPSNYVKRVVENIIQKKDSKYAYLGISVNTYYSGDILKFLGYPEGIVVERVAEGSPAAKAGVQANDIITEFDEVEISSYDEYNEQRLNHSPGEEITLTVYRNGEYFTANLTLGEANS